MNSTLKIILAFKLKLLLIIVSIACTFYVDSKLTPDNEGEDTNSHVASGRENIDNTVNINNTDTTESSSLETKSSLSYYKVAGQGQIADRLYIEIRL